MVRGLFALTPENEPVLELTDAGGKLRATLGSSTVKNEKTGAMEKRPTSSLLLYDETGTVVFAAPRK